jgi:DNA repair exonuclease SbcCD ATPase subunit
VIGSLALVLLLARAPEEVDARAELDACAERIEALKAKRRAGQAAERELERLLVRAQELAAELERARAELPAAPAAPAPEELRERADAARDEADRLAAEIAALDVKIADARREVRADSGPTLTHAVLGSAPPASADALARLHSLLEKRATLARERALAAATAARLEEEASAAEAER